MVYRLFRGLDAPCGDTMFAQNDIAELYRSGLSAAEVASRVGVSSGTVINVLKSKGVQRRGRGDANRRCEPSTAQRLYGLGLSTTQIGRILGVHSTTVLKTLQASGCPMRSVETGVSIAYSEDELQRWFGGLGVCC